MTGHTHKDGLTSLSIFITPQCYKITTIPPSVRQRTESVPYTKPRKESVIPQVRPQLFPAESIKQSLPFPSLPSLPMRALFDAVADIVNQQLAAFLPAHLLGSFACACPSLITLFLISLFSLSLLVSAFQPSQAKYVTKSAEKKTLPCPKVSPLVGIPVSFLFSVQTRRPTPYVCFWLCLYRYETTPFNGNRHEGGGALDFLLNSRVSALRLGQDDIRSSSAQPFDFQALRQLSGMAPSDPS